MKKILISNFIASWGFTEEKVVEQAAGKYSISSKFIQIKKRALDVRSKRPKGVYTFQVDFNKETEGLLNEKNARVIEIETFDDIVPLRPRNSLKPIICGFGPAGLFAALTFIERGIKPIIIERGKPVEDRAQDVNSLWRNNTLDCESNALFGEGGAGTFSDGKLTTRVNHPFTDYVLEKLSEFGARDKIRIDSKPHIGTDRLIKVMTASREFLIEKGATIHFSSRLEKFYEKNGTVTVICNNGLELSGDCLLLATGHSARDTYEYLYKSGVSLEPKPFAAGMRIEHPQEEIDSIMYGKGNRNKYGLPPASYQFAWNGNDNRGCYTFCMCPGGEVILTVNEENTLCVNGMSNSKRNSPFANSAVVAKVPVKSFYEDSPLDGITFQRNLEMKAYQMGIPGYMCPSQKAVDFVKGNMSRSPLASSYPQALYSYPMSDILPDFIVEDIISGLKSFDSKAKGFLSDKTNLLGVETRTSAPLRILRDKDTMRSLSHPLVIPCGEGSGYAGGIMSSAIDGMKAAAAVMKS